MGQHKIRKQLSLLLDAAKLQGRTSDHILLAGPPGLGKTTLAMIVAHESGHPLRLTSGPTIQHAGDLAAVLSSLAPGEILFIDEIHRMARPAEEMLYLAMEDFRVDVMVGKGPGATSIPLELAPFTLVGATTRSGMLPNPLRDRFGFTAHLEFYSNDELAQVIARAANRLAIEISGQDFHTISLQGACVLNDARQYCIFTQQLSQINSSFPSAAHWQSPAPPARPRPLAVQGAGRAAPAPLRPPPSSKVRSGSASTLHTSMA